MLFEKAWIQILSPYSVHSPVILMDVQAIVMVISMENGIGKLRISVNDPFRRFY